MAAVIPSADDIVKQIADIPPLPSTFIKIIELTRNPDRSVADLVKAISVDQGMVMRILKVCNSPFYGLKSRMTSVAQAASYLGFAALQGIAATQATKGILSKKIAGYDLEAGDLYKHSLAVALAARIIAEKKYPKQKETAFTAGLLHDVGKTVLATYVSSAFQEILDVSASTGKTFDAAEQQVLGFGHNELGDKLAEKWKMADAIRNPIRYHHHPAECPGDATVTHIVHVADSVAMMLGLGAGADGMSYTLNQGSLAVCGITETDLNAVMERLMTEFDEAMTSFS